MYGSRNKLYGWEDDLVLQLGEVDVLTRNGLNLHLCGTENKHLIPGTEKCSSRVDK